MFEQFLQELFAPQGPSNFDERFAGPPASPLDELMSRMPQKGSFDSGLGTMDRNVVQDPRFNMPPDRMEIPDWLLENGRLPGGMDGSTIKQKEDGSLVEELSARSRQPGIPLPPPRMGYSEEMSPRSAPAGIPLPPVRPAMPMGGDMPVPQGPMGAEGGGAIPMPPNAPPGLLDMLMARLGGGEAMAQAPGERRPGSRFINSLGAGMKDADARFGGGAFMKGMGGAIGGGQKQDNDDRDYDLKNRAMTDKEKTSAIYRDLLAARAKNATSAGSGGAKSPWDYRAGRGIDPETGQVVDGSYRINKATGAQEFLPGMIQTNKADSAERSGFRERDLEIKGRRADVAERGVAVRENESGSKTALQDARREAILSGDIRKAQELEQKIHNWEAGRGLTTARTDAVGRDQDRRDLTEQRQGQDSASRRGLDAARSDAISRGENRRDTELDDKLDNSRSRRSLDAAREKGIREGKGSNGAWNKPAHERLKDAEKLIMDKEKSLKRELPLSGARRQAAVKAMEPELEAFKKKVYSTYGIDANGKETARAPSGEPPMGREGGRVPSTDKTVGDREATDAGLYPTGSYDDPAEPASRDEFDALPPGSYFKNPADGRILRKRG